jgi:MFS family permease
MRAETEPGPLPQRLRRYTMVILAIVYMFNFIDRQVLAILLPGIKAEFQVGDGVLGFLAGTAFALFYVVMGVPIARLADRVNRRNLIALAVALWSGMTALSGLAGNIWQLALARIGVGIGEAGCSPAAHSMIADLYPPERRSTAMGFYTLGISAGIMLAYLGGGWVAQNVGWRQAFFVVGLPGLLVAGVVRFTIVEPVRGAAEARRDSGRPFTLPAVARFLLERRSFLHMTIAAGLSAFVGYGMISFLPSFMVRSFATDVAVLGAALGLIYGIAGGFGFFMGGYCADRIGRRGQRRALNFIALAALATTVLHGGVLLAPSASWCLLSLIVPAATSNLYLAPVLSQAQGLVSLRMRAVASSFTLLIINTIGLGIGPWATGLLSDALEPHVHGESMRYSLLCVSTILLPWAAWHFRCAGRFIEADLRRADEHD